MRTTSRLFRTVLAAAGLMAVSATAAQAMAMGPANVPDRDPLGFTAAHHQPPVATRLPGGAVVLHRSGFQLHHMQFTPGLPMAAAADSATNQTAPPVVVQPVSVQSADDGFDWTAAAIGAMAASVVLILAAVAAAIVRPRQTAQL
jgi:hypothetical protein